MVKKLSRRAILKAAGAAAGLPLMGSPLRSILASGFQAGLPAAANSSVPALPPLAVSFVDVGKAAGLTTETIFGGVEHNIYLLETTGCGAACFDYDNDGWLDIFLVNGTRLNGFPSGQRPTNRLYKNNRDGTFTDVTERAGLVRTGWGQGVCIGDYDNDGFDDLFVTYWGKNVLYHNNGDGTFTDVADKAGITTDGTRWNTGCAFVDYDRDGQLDLFVANYAGMDLKTAPLPSSGPCLYKSAEVACGPPGLPGGKNILFHNNGDGTFTDVSVQAGITRASGVYGLGVLTGDFDNDGWPDIFVADDSNPSLLYHNNHNGTYTEVGIIDGCAYSQDGKPQAGMGATAGDYDCDGWLDIFKTNFSEDTSTLYHNTGSGVFDDVTYPAGIGVNTRMLGWGCGFTDMDNDGWIDIFVCNGHIYPELKTMNLDIKYKEPKVVYRNLRNGRFLDVTKEIGGALLTPISARGCAFGDFDNDGDLDVLVNPVNDFPQLFRCDVKTGYHWLKVRTHGTKSNRSGIGARLECITGKHRQIDEVRSGGSYASQNDLRVHFGLGEATTIDQLTIKWPSGHVDQLQNIAADQTIHVEEAKGIMKS